MSIRPEFERAVKLVAKIKYPLIVEIGSHVGDGAIYIDKNTQNVKIYAIEPDVKNYLKLLKRVPNNVHCFNCAIGKESGRTTFYTGADRANSIHKKVLEYKSKKKGSKIMGLDVDAHILTDFLKTHNISHIDLLRFDCYGAEYDIFETDQYFLTITDVVCINMHRKKKLFNSGDYVHKRNRIQSAFIHHSFRQIAGGDLSGKKHICQLWRKHD